MDQTFLDILDADSARLLRTVLREGDTDNATPDLVAEAERRAVEVSQEIKSTASTNDASSFARELTGFLDGARERALKAKRLQAEIDSRQKQIAKTQAEIKRMSAGRPLLAEAVNETASRYEEARSDYGRNEFSIATAEELVVQRRSEIAALRRQMAKNQEGE